MSQPVHWPHIINLGNSIIGVAMLALPFCYQQCGIILGTLVLGFSTWLNLVSCELLMKAGIATRRRSYEYLAYDTFGAPGKLAVEIGMIGLQIGTLIAQIVIIGDLGPNIVSKLIGVEIFISCTTGALSITLVLWILPVPLFQSIIAENADFSAQNTPNLRMGLIIALCMCVALPLGLMKNLQKLSRASALCICIYFIFILFIFIQSAPNMWSGKWFQHVHFWRMEGLFQCLPIFSFAFGCQTQLFILYDSLLEPSLKTINSITSCAINICMVVYLLVGFFGYIAFYEEKIAGDIILLFPSNIFSDVMKLLFVFSIAVSIPLIVYPCRSSIVTMMFPQKHKQQDGEVVSSGGITHFTEFHFKCITLFIITGAMVIGICVPNVEFILGLNGATMGTLICYIFPALFFLKIMSKAAEGKPLAQLVLVMGITVLLVSTYQTLNKQDQSHVHEDMKMDAKHLKVEELMPKQPDANKQPPPGIVNHNNIQQKDATSKEKDKIIASDKRKEPPIPQEPDHVDQKNKESQNTVTKAVKAPLTVTKSNKSDDKQKESVEKKMEKNAEKEQVLKEKENKLKEGEKKQAEIIHKLEKQQVEQKKLIEEQKEILKELKKHKDSHVDEKKTEPELKAGQEHLEPQVAQSGLLNKDSKVDNQHNLQQGDQNNKDTLKDQSNQHMDGRNLLDKSLKEEGKDTDYKNGPDNIDLQAFDPELAGLLKKSFHSEYIHLQDNKNTELKNNNFQQGGVDTPQQVVNNKQDSQGQPLQKHDQPAAVQAQGHVADQKPPIQQNAQVLNVQQQPQVQQQAQVPQVQQQQANGQLPQAQHIQQQSQIQHESLGQQQPQGNQVQQQSQNQQVQPQVLVQKLPQVQQQPQIQQQPLLQHVQQQVPAQQLHQVHIQQEPQLQKQPPQQVQQQLQIQQAQQKPQVNEVEKQAQVNQGQQQHPPVQHQTQAQQVQQQPQVPQIQVHQQQQVEQQQVQQQDPHPDQQQQPQVQKQESQHVPQQQPQVQQQKSQHVQQQQPEVQQQELQHVQQQPQIQQQESQHVQQQQPQIQQQVQQQPQIQKKDTQHQIKQQNGDQQNIPDQSQVVNIKDGDRPGDVLGGNADSPNGKKSDTPVNKDSGKENIPNLDLNDKETNKHKDDDVKRKDEVKRRRLRSVGENSEQLGGAMDNLKKQMFTDIPNRLPMEGHAKMKKR